METKRTTISVKSIRKDLKETPEDQINTKIAESILEKIKAAGVPTSKSFNFTVVFDCEMHPTVANLVSSKVRSMDLYGQWRSELDPTKPSTFDNVKYCSTLVITPPKKNRRQK